LRLSAIYQPIQEDLAKVEEQFTLLIKSQDDTLPELRQMLRHVLGGGKRIRPALTLLAGKFYDYNSVSLLLVATASELLHIGTLVHDDVIDKASVRHGRATVNRLWGEDKAILLGDYLFAKAAGFGAATGNLRVINLFPQTLQTICRGELKQGFTAFKLEQSFDDYIERITSKTALLFAMATESGAILSQAPEEAVQTLKDYGCNMGIAFQIVDDILDFIGTEKELGKPIGSDLAQGTITLPTLMLLERYPEDNPVKKVFNNEDKQKNVELAIEQARNSSIIDECYQVAVDYSTKACQNLAQLPDCPGHQALLDLARYVVRRKR